MDMYLPALPGMASFFNIPASRFNFTPIFLRCRHTDLDKAAMEEASRKRAEQIEREADEERKREEEMLNKPIEF
jgi:hypothetical protein